MKTVNDIYNVLGQSVVENAPDNWEKAILQIEVLQDFSSYNGFYITSKGKHEMSVFDFPVETGDYIRELHKIITKGGTNKWNKANFTVTPDKKFDMEFKWDQEWQDEVDENNRKQAEKDPKYVPPKWHWEK